MEMCVSVHVYVCATKHAAYEEVEFYDFYLMERCEFY